MTDTTGFRASARSTSPTGRRRLAPRLRRSVLGKLHWQQRRFARFVAAQTSRCTVGIASP